MSKEPLKVSDWVVYLSSIIDISSSTVIGLLSVSVVLFALFYNPYYLSNELYQNYPIVLDILKLTILFPVLGIGWIFLSRKSDVNRAKKLLKRIMNGECNDPKIISEEWSYKPRFKMTIDKIFRFVIGIIVIFSGIAMIYEYLESKIFEKFVFLNLILIALVLYVFLKRELFN